MSNQREGLHAASASNQLRRFFEYHSWATRKLINFCSGLASEEQKLTAAGTLGTIERTLTHLVSSEQFYLRDLTGDDPPQWIESRIVPVAELVARATENAERWRSYLDSEPDPEEVFTTMWRGSAKRVVRWGAVAQAIRPWC